MSLDDDGDDHDMMHWERSSHDLFCVGIGEYRENLVTIIGHVDSL